MTVVAVAVAVTETILSTLSRRCPSRWIAGSMLLWLAAMQSFAGSAERAACLGAMSDSAINACRTELASGSRDHEIYTALNNHLSIAGRFEEALAVSEEALLTYPNDRELEQLRRVARSNLQEQEWSASRSSANSGTGQGEESAELKLNRLYCRTRQGSEALSACEKVLAAVPDDPDAIRRRTRLRSAAGSASLGQPPAEVPKPLAESELKRATGDSTDPDPDDRRLVARIQESLNQLGFDAGAVDGLPGRRTRAAAKQFSELPGVVGVDPRLDHALVEALAEALARDRSAADLISEAEEALGRGNLERALQLAGLARSQAPWRLQASDIEGEIERQVAKRNEASHKRTTEIRRLADAIERALEAGNLEEAETTASAALKEYPSENDLVLLRQRVLDERNRLAELDERSRERAAELLTRAQAARYEGFLPLALEYVADGLSIQPGHPGLLALRDQIESEQGQIEDLRRKALAAEARVEELRLSSLEALEADDLQTSLALVEEGLILSPKHTALAEIRSRVVEQRARKQRQRDEDLERDRHAQQNLAHARQARSEEDIDTALEHVDEGLQFVPNHPELLSLRAELGLDRAQMLADQREAERLLAQATNFREAEDMESSLNAVNQGLKRDPMHQGLLALKRDVELEIQHMRQVRIEGLRLLGLANDAYRANQFAIAQGYALRGLELVPHNQELTDLKASVDKEIMRLRQEQAQAEERARRAEETLQQARDLRQMGELKQSLTLIAEGLERVPEHGGLLDLHRDVSSELAKREEYRRSFELLISQAEDALGEGDLEFAGRLLKRGRLFAPDDPRLSSLQKHIDAQRTVIVNEQVAKYIERARRRIHAAQSTSSESDSLSERFAAYGDAQAEIEKGLRIAPDDPTLKQLATDVGSELKAIEVALADRQERENQIEFGRRKLIELQRALAMIKAENEADELSSRVLAQKILEGRASND